jgi:hypothetical protein
MLQVRLKEGGDKKWFNPARDITNIMPGLVRAALRSFDEFEGSPDCSAQELMTTAQELGLMFKWIIDEPVSHEDAKKRFEEITKAHPAASKLISQKFMLVLTGIYAVWIADVKPKSEDDAKIPTIGLSDVIDYLLSEKVYAACDCGCQHFSMSMRQPPYGDLVCDMCGKPVRRMRAPSGTQTGKP